MIKKRKNLVLGLGTIIHFESPLLAYPDVKPRPYLKDFLHFVFKKYKTVTIWSTIEQEETEIFLLRIKEFFPQNVKVGILTFNDCFVKEIVQEKVREGPFKIKIVHLHIVKDLRVFFDLSKIFNEKNTVTVDNSISTSEHCFGNFFLVSEYKGIQFDDGLLDIMKKLKNPKLIKKNWRSEEKIRGNLINRKMLRQTLSGEKIKKLPQIKKLSFDKGLELSFDKTPLGQPWFSKHGVEGISYESLDHIV